MANFEHRRKLSSLIEDTTKARDGVQELNEASMKGIKDLVKLSNENVRSTYDLVLDQLKSKNSQTRYLTVLLMDYLFTRSKYFRELVVKDLQPFFERAVGADSDKPLPPPVHWATLTREKSLELLEKWNEEFGKFYKQLKQGYIYLKHTRKMQFPDLRARQTRQEEQQRAREEKTQRILRAKFDMLQKEFDDMAPEVTTTLQQMDAAFSILMPDPTIAFVNSDTDSTTTTSSSDIGDLINQGDDEEPQHDGEPQDENGALTMDEIVRSHGLGSASYELDITINKTIGVANENNTAVVDILQDCMRMLNNKFVPTAKGWAKVLMKFQATQAERATHDALLKKIIDLQHKLNAALAKCKELNVDVMASNKPILHSVEEAFVAGLDDSMDNSFVEDDGTQMVLVPAKDGYEEFAKEDDDFASLEHELFSESSTEGYTTSFDNVNNNVYNLFVNNEEAMIETNMTYNFITPRKTPPASTKALAPATPTTPTTTSTTSTTTSTTTSPIAVSSPPLYSTSPQNVDPKIYVPYWQKDGPAQPLPQEAKEDKSRAEMLARAPIVPAGTFLQYWGQDEIDVNSGMELSHRFLGSSKAGTVIASNNLTDLFMRTTYYEPKERPLVKICGAPLKDGKVCTRRDLKCCPFHGPVIPRDEKGQPIQLPDITNTTSPTTLPTAYNNNTHINKLTTPEKKRGRKKKEPGVRERLEDKITPKKKSRPSL